MGELTFAEALLEEDIFLLASDEDEEIGPIHMFNNIDDVEAHLARLNPIIDSNMRLLHGVLTSAEFLPSSFHGKSAYVVCTDPDESSDAMVIESGALGPKELADELEQFLNGGGGVFATIPDIDDIFIFYGYEISTCLAPVLEDMDDEAIETCKLIAEEATAIMERAKKEK